ANTILTGHSIGHDLEALRIIHPFIIDSRDIFQFKKLDESNSLGEKFPVLVQTLLPEITLYQINDDPIYSIKLLKLKLKNDISFGDIRRGGWIPSYDDIDRILDVYDFTNTRPLAMQVTDEATIVSSVANRQPQQRLNAPHQRPEG